MIDPDFHALERLRIERTLRVAEHRFGLRPANVGTAANLPGARAVIEIDPVTGHPVEADTGSLFYPGDLPGDTTKGLA